MSPSAASNGPGLVPRRRLTAARRRRQLFDVAIETFALSGFDSTTMEEIATAAGVTKPLLYQHFASKRALYLELIDDVSSRLLKALAEAASGETTGWRRVLADMQAYFLFVLQNQSAIRLLFDAPQDEELARGLHALEDAMASFVAPLVEADIDDEHRRVVAAGVVGMTEGITRAWLSSRRSSSVEDVHQEVLRLAHRAAELAWGGLRSLRRDV
jgi:AcrR family transcriptional regulator